jgi:DNA-binding PadR family transcriptional regulator
MPDNNLTDIELVLLQIISQQKRISGYRINKLIDERGYRDWVEISSSSIYLSLAKLQRKGLVQSFFDTHKRGKGPPPRHFSISDVGKKQLASEILATLSSAESGSTRFYLGIAGIPFVTCDEAINALRQRLRRLEVHSALIERRFSELGGSNLRLHIRALYRRSLALIAAEVRFVNELISELERERAKNADRNP